MLGVAVVGLQCARFSGFCCGVLCCFGDLGLTLRFCLLYFGWLVLCFVFVGWLIWTLRFVCCFMVGLF